MKFIPAKDIEKKAIEFLENHHPDGSIPIPIEKIIEINLGIKIIPVQDLFKNHDIDGFSTHEFKAIYIDYYLYLDNENRSRFTFAHEMGHYCLHKQFMDGTQFNTPDEWKKFIVTDFKRREPLETQANMFAGFLLLPTDSLEIEFESEKTNLAKMQNYPVSKLPNDKTIAPYLASHIARKFKVSERCAELRIKNWLDQSDRL